MKGRVLFRRLILLLKLIYKPIFLIAGYGLYALSMMNDNRIYVEKPEIKTMWQLIVWSAKQVPLKEALLSYKDAMLTFNHRGMAGTITLFMAIPFIPLLLKAMFKGMGRYVAYWSQYLIVDYVYKDTSAYAYSDWGIGLHMIIGGFAIRFALGAILYEAAPVVLVISWFWNLIQFLWHKRSADVPAVQGGAV